MKVKIIIVSLFFVFFCASICYGGARKYQLPEKPFPAPCNTQFKAGQRYIYETLSGSTSERFCQHPKGPWVAISTGYMKAFVSYSLPKPKGKTEKRVEIPPGDQISPAPWRISF